MITSRPTPPSRRQRRRRSVWSPAPGPPEHPRQQRERERPQQLAAEDGADRRDRHVVIEVPRDRDGTFEPQIVKKRQRRLGAVDEMILALYAKGLTTGEISAHFAEIYGASVSKETVSRIVTDRVVEEMQAWQSRPLDEVYAAVFIDAIVVKVRDGQVANRPVYAAIGVTLGGGKRTSPASGPAPAGEGAGFWMSVLTDLKNRGVRTCSSWSATASRGCRRWSPGLRRRNPHRDLFHQRDREPECPLPAGREGPRALPDRAVGDQVPLPGDPLA